MNYTDSLRNKDGLEIELKGLLSDNYPIAKESLHEYGIKNFAYTFYKECKSSEHVSVSMLTAAKNAILCSDEDLVIILASGLTWKKSYTKKYFEKATTRCEKMDDYYNLISITAMASYMNTASQAPVDTTFLDEAIDEFIKKYGLRFMLEVKRFILVMRLDIELKKYQNIEKEIQKELYALDHYYEIEKKRKEELERIRREKQQIKEELRIKKVMKLESIKKREKEQKDRQALNNEQRTRFLESFYEKPLEEQLRTIAADKRRSPKYYALNYDQITDEELANVNRTVLKAAYEAYPIMRDKQWQAFRKRIALLI